MKNSITSHFIGLGCSILIVFGIGNTHAQFNEIILNSPDSGNKTYVANQRIEFLPGYSFTASAIDKMVAYIDGGIIVPNYYTDLYTASSFDNRELNSSFAVGATSGAPSVTETGAFTYSIPVQIPVGTNGMIPQIAVGYNSQAGNGLLGMGWNLQGLSMISRTNKNLYYDNEVRAVQCDNDDVFALDGGRLMEISGTYGTNGAVYATESEDFSRVYSHGTQGNGSEWFEVKTKEGFTIEYGKTSDSRLDNNGTILFWMINRIKDTHGNYVDYVYENYHYELRIKEIRYTGNANFGMQPYNRIQFNYKERADPFDYYMAHKKIKNASILDNIIVLAEGQQFKKYEFKYGCKLYSFLNEVIEYGVGEERFNSSGFRYETAVGELDYNANIASGPGPLLYISKDQSSSRQFFGVADFNGNGNNDLVKVTLNSSSPVEQERTILSNNISLQIISDNGSQNNLNFNQIGSEFISTISSQFYIPQGNNNFKYNSNYNIPSSNFSFFDFDGDGKADILGYTLNHSVEHGYSIADIQLRKSNIDVNGNVSFNLIYSATNLAPWHYIANIEKFSFIGDFNGDGIFDVLYITQDQLGNEFLAGIAKGSHTNSMITGFGQNTQRIINFQDRQMLATADDVLVVDFNGDGKSDLMILKDGVLKIYSFKTDIIPGTQIISENIAELLYQGNWAIESFDENFRIGDFNGDGNTDFLVLENSVNFGNGWRKYTHYRIYYSTGASFEEKLFTIGRPFFYSTYGPFNDIQDALIVLDANNDGKSDLLHLSIFNEEGTSVDGVNYAISKMFETRLYQSNGTAFDRTIVNNEYFEPSPTSDNNSRIYNFKYTIVGNFYNESNAQVLVPRIKVINGVSSDLFTYGLLEVGNKKLGLLHDIKDGFNNLTSIEYNTITNNSIGDYSETPSNPHISPNYPVSNFNFPISVVKLTTIQTPEGNTASTQFSYFGGKLHKRGKGFLGFSKVEQTDELSGIRSSSEFEFNTTYFHPFLKKTTTSFDDTDVLISGVNYNYVFEPMSDDRFIYYVENEHSVDYVYEREVDVSYDFNLNTGNLNSTTTVNSGTETTLETYLYGTFGNELSIPNKVTQSEVTVTRQGEQPFSKTSTFDYHSQTGNLEKVVDFVGTAESVTKEMEYNAAGNITKETISAIGMEPRIKTYGYEGRRRFPITHTNELGQISIMEYHPIFGKPVKVTDIHNLVTETTLDEFGRDIQMIDPLGNTYLTTYAWENTSPSATQGNPLQADDVMWKIVKSGTGMPTSTTYMNRLGMKRMSKVEGMNEDVFSVTTFNNKGQVVAETAPFFSGQTDVLITEYTYDELNRVTKAENQAGTTNIVYESTDGVLKTTTTSPDGTVQISEEDAAGMLLKSEDDGGELVYTYYSHGGVKQITLNNEVVATSEYDEYGRQTKLIDANAGESTYEYNAFGEMISQTNANNETTTMVYDPVGRLEERIIPNRTLTMEYYTEGNGLNQVKKITLPESTEEMVYDNFQRPVELKKMVDGQEFVFQYAYDQLGNLDKLTYPTGYFVNHVYDSKGYLLRITDPDAHILWEVDEQDAFGRIVKFTKGDGIQTKMNFDYLGRLEEIKAGNVQHHTYQFNLLNGILSERKDNLKGLVETFEYDNLERLEEARASIVSTSVVTNLIETTYSANGNIESKTDAGIYAYDTQKKNAVVHVDNDLEQISFNTQEILYTPSAKSARITEGDKRMYFTYGADDERIMTKLVELDNGNENILLKKYFVGLYEKELEGTTERHIHYIMAGDGLTAIAIKEDEDPAETYFTYKDHLGSIVTLTNDNGDVFFEQSFDAWGRYRNPNDWTYNNINEPPTWLRGYTGHEHLVQFDLVNMNGRMYDPKLGRMLRPDNFVQNPMFTQSYNRYTYAFNNPLKYTDPDGEMVFSSISLVVDFFVTLFDGGLSSDKETRKQAWRNYDPTAEWSATGKARKIDMGLLKTDPNKSDGERVWEFISRFTWQGGQTAVGYLTSGINHSLFYGVKSVDYYGGATAIETYASGWGGVTLGNYVLGERGMRASPYDPLFQHEYGHYLQSQVFGPWYFSRIGIPSLGSINQQGGVTHSYHSAEQDANVRAFEYFNKHIDDYNVNGIDWHYSNPIYGYDWTKSYNDSFNQAVLKSRKMKLTPLDLFLGPDIISMGVINILLLNNQQKKLYYEFN